MLGVGVDRQHVGIHAACERAINLTRRQQKSAQLKVSGIVEGHQIQRRRSHHQCVLRDEFHLRHIGVVAGDVVRENFVIVVFLQKVKPFLKPGCS